MLKRLIKRIKEYYNRRSRLSIAGDLLFYGLIILLLIPPTRKVISSSLIRIVKFQPGKRHIVDDEKLSEKDYVWQMESLEGSPVFLGDFYGEVMFVNFWATWCPPCIGEMPSLQKLYDSYNQKVAFLFVTGEEPSTVAEFLKKGGFDLPVFIQKYREPETLNASSFPTTYIISGDGDIVLRKTGAANWNGPKVRDLLDQLLSSNSNE
jgi:thiol-disulfide isomerase/thioredoxin